MFRRRLVVPLVALVAIPLKGFAQTPTTPVVCEGRVVDSIAINPGRPPFAGSARRWQTIARALGLHHATTRADVIRAYLLFRPGDPCSDARISESERILRSLPFLAGATIEKHADPAGGVVVDVRTTDEIPVLVSGRLRGAVPSALSLGNENVGGLGLRVLAGGERSGVYRGAARLQVDAYALFGQPIDARLRAERNRLGGHVEGELSRPFLSSLQRGAWQGSFRDGHDFPIILRPTGDNAAIDVRERKWSLGGVVRWQLGSTPALWGPVALGTTLSPMSRTILVTDSGPVAFDDASLTDRTRALQSNRLGALLGLRRVNYVLRTGLDGLFAQQEVMTGWQAGGLVAPGTGTRRDVLFATSIYVGAASRMTAIMGDIEAEARRDFAAGAQPSMIANARVVAYLTPTSRLTITVQDNFSSIAHAFLPTQLSFGDPIGGPRGFLGSSIAGGRRNVARTEIRWASPSAIKRADLGVALFADLATMNAGDVPYGVTASRQSVGFSLLGAFPTQSKRLYRIDFAIPLQHDVQGNRWRGIQVRFTNGDPTIAMSREPSDVTQARLVPVPSSLFAWPGR